MQIVFHAGAHMTDEDRLLNCLTRNRDALAAEGVHVPPPRRYRKLLRDMLVAADRNGLAADAPEVFRDSVIEQDGPADRLILSNDSFFGTPRMAVNRAQFYASAVPRLEIFRQILGRDGFEFFFALRDPATFLPALLAQTKLHSVDDLISGADPAELRWSEMVLRLREAFPDMPITIWCNEDTPLTWGEVLREMAGLPPTDPVAGEFALLEEIMTEAGMKRFHAYLETHPGLTEAQKRRVIAAFLDKFAKEEEIEQELDLPGWTEDMVTQLSEIYDDDIYAIGRIEGVNLITP